MGGAATRTSPSSGSLWIAEQSVDPWHDQKSFSVFLNGDHATILGRTKFRNKLKQIKLLTLHIASAMSDGSTPATVAIDCNLSIEAWNQLRHVLQQQSLELGVFFLGATATHRCRS